MQTDAISSYTIKNAMQISPKVSFNENIIITSITIFSPKIYSPNRNWISRTDYPILLQIQIQESINYLYSESRDSKKCIGSPDQINEINAHKFYIFRQKTKNKQVFKGELLRIKKCKASKKFICQIKGRVSFIISLL